MNRDTDPRTASRRDFLKHSTLGAGLTGRVTVPETEAGAAGDDRYPSEHPLSGSPIRLIPSPHHPHFSSAIPRSPRFPGLLTSSPHPLITAALTALLFLPASGCVPESSSSPTQTAPAATTRLTLTGASTVAPLAGEIGKRFEQQHPGVRVDVQTGGSSRGVADARQGMADIGMVSRALKPGEQDLQSFTIARDGVCLIVHRDNPVKSLTDTQVVDIYTGKKTRWNGVGGAEAPITVVHKAEGRSTLELFLHYFKLDNEHVKAQVVIGDNEQGIKTVAGNPHAIGYVSIGAAEFQAKSAVPLKLLPVGGMQATTENVRNEKFPLARPLNLVTRTKPEGQARAFIAFARSAAVRDLIEKQYFVPVADEQATH